ncbi:unnamed protein product [Cuscuta epithymum]|uniref:Uncharacterized protein n=1 Tax=Cuscuta epithymum TaxID=186058 RepID=A0AAV0D9K1_9ASTE|nr:unnamed protein product [Cuscuta epithymum]
MSSTLPTHLKLRPPIHPINILGTHNNVVRVKSRNRTLHTRLKVHFSVHRRFSSRLSLLSRASSDGESDTPTTTTRESSSPATGDSLPNIGDGYVSLFIRMLGLDNDPLDRESAIVALWKYSLGGKKCVDAIMQFPGSLNLTVNLLRSESDCACEAAAGLLRMVSSINVYRDFVAESGAIEEITGLLGRSSVYPDVKEQSICALWNFTVDEKYRIKIANSDLLHILITLLEDDDVRVKEAAGGVLANLTLTSSNHKIMVEAGVIPKLATLLKTEVKGSKVVRKEARIALLELAKDEYNKILVMEEGLLMVPLVGAAAYKSFKPTLYSWPSFPDGTQIEKRPKSTSKYGASELLLGLHVLDDNANIDEAMTNAMVGQARQQFLARIGAIEVEDNKSNDEVLSCRSTLLPWVDGVARLVLILGLEDESAVARAAEAIADASITEHLRVSFRAAGAINQLTKLINHPSDTIRCASVRALERLSVSNAVCQRLGEENILHPLINLLNNLDVSNNIIKMVVDILSRVLDPSKEMKSKFFEGPINLSTKGLVEIRNMESGGEENEKAVSTKSLKTPNVVELLDSSVIARLIEIMKTSSPDMQKKVASILEFVSVVEACTEKIFSIDMESGLDAVFQQECLKATRSDFDGWRPKLHALEIEEAGWAISAASRLLTRLLEFEHFRRVIDASHFTELLRRVLKSNNVPLHHKEWVAACLVKLTSLSRPGPYSSSSSENPIDMEVTLYETIPRLVEQMQTSFSPEAAVVELNKIISKGVVGSTQALSAAGGIFPLVSIIESGTEKAVEAGIAVLYNLSMDAENHAAIVAAGAVPVLRRIVLSQRPQWMRALCLLRNLPT